MSFLFSGLVPVPLDSGMLLEDSIDLYEWLCFSGRTVPYELWADGGPPPPHQDPSLASVL